jgi:hypothetical protein
LLSVLDAARNTLQRGAILTFVVRSAARHEAGCARQADIGRFATVTAKEKRLPASQHFP